MNIASVRPSTLDGIKQLATKLKREKRVTHTAALDLASRQAGFENFVHARRGLDAANPRHGAYLSAHWFYPRDQKPPTERRGGRELLFVELRSPLPTVIAKHRVSSARGLVGFRMEYEDHLEHLTNFPSQENARDALLQAARALHFMDATGLQPVTTQVLRSATRALQDLPGKDHQSRWFDPTTHHWLVLDEPYGNAIKGADEKRGDWLAARQLHMARPAWEGIYFPGECLPYLIGPDANILAGVAEALGALRPIRAPDPWPFETGRNGDDFVSPLRAAAGTARKPRPNRSYRDHNGARPYGGAPGVPSRWRPIQSLPLADHVELGTLFTTVASVGFGWRAHMKLERCRSDLESWALIEHRDAAPNDLYYGDIPRRTFVNAEEVLDALRSAKAIVEKGYNPCRPRATIIEALDAAIAQSGKLKFNRARR